MKIKEFLTLKHVDWILAHTVWADSIRLTGSATWLLGLSAEIQCSDLQPR